MVINLSFRNEPITLRLRLMKESVIWQIIYIQISIHRISHLEVFLVKGALKICSKFTGEHPCRSIISIKLLCIFIEMTLRHGCSSVNLLHVFRTPFTKNTSGRLLLHTDCLSSPKGSSIKYIRKIFRKTNISYPLIRTRKCMY